MANKFNVEEGKWGEENIVSRRESRLYDVIGVNKFLPKKLGSIRYALNYWFKYFYFILLASPKKQKKKRN